MELQDQLDGKSDMLHNVEDDLKNTISILKEQVRALEKKLTVTNEEKDQLAQ